MGGLRATFPPGASSAHICEVLVCNDDVGLAGTCSSPSEWCRRYWKADICPPCRRDVRSAARHQMSSSFRGGTAKRPSAGAPSASAPAPPAKRPKQDREVISISSDSSDSDPEASPPVFTESRIVGHFQAADTWFHSLTCIQRQS
jgi:hypothetical protein